MATVAEDVGVLHVKWLQFDGNTRWGDLLRSTTGLDIARRKTLRDF